MKPHPPIQDIYEHYIKRQYREVKKDKISSSNDLKREKTVQLIQERKDSLSVVKKQMESRYINWRDL